MIGDESFGQFLGLSANLKNLAYNSLVIVMNTGGGMGLYTDMAKKIATGIADIQDTLEYKPNNYILSLFNDSTWGSPTSSESLDQFTTEISKLSAYDGGNQPVLYYHGVVEALKQTDRVQVNTDDVDGSENVNGSDSGELPAVTGGVTIGVNFQTLNATKDYIIQRLNA
ncbi:unnamed protein product, partial [Didymodactylos carnosus]